ncbi:nucleotide disphospho-sugar-binding domain-containing protein [Williamsia sp. 1135]|uniref:glycosyltransferase n=1 Tax=Williamsia sp. 1135 TaxID=1889262 RepID=UPI000A113E97|nr:nucleotide disphospho-sugar-binding domain-containing protein [Williamsia sp. 1135]ORM24234.1 glycosyl transferase [Williamsia sp. 1135]
MRVALVAGSDAGHALPVLALAELLQDKGFDPVVYTGSGWIETAAARGLQVRELPGLGADRDDDDSDAGAKLGVRAARMCELLVPLLRRDPPDLVVCDVITVCGGWAAETLRIPWVELSPHPLYSPSRALPPIGSGLAAGTGVRGRLRDTLLRAATDRSIAVGRRQRQSARREIGLPAREQVPAARLIATLPALEVPRPDWPGEAEIVGPLLWEPTDVVFTPPPGDAPLVVIAPSTATTGAAGLAETALEALAPDLLGRPVRAVVSGLAPTVSDLPSWAIAGHGRQDLLLAQAALVICGGGHGMLAKSLIAGVPQVLVPGGGDQWELAQRARRWGCAEVVRPVTARELSASCRKVLDSTSFAESARSAGSSAADTVDPVAVCARAAGGPGASLLSVACD